MRKAVDLTDPFTEAGFRALARTGLTAAPSPAIFDPRSGRALGPGDWDLSPELKGDLAAMGAPRPAAVLVPIVLHPELTVLFTQRSHEVPSHPGQISFPGGKVEACDATPIDCALREAREEIGLTADHVEPLGFLDSYRTGTGFQISPVVAFVRPGFRQVLDPREVVEVFEVPLAFLMDTSNHQKHAREWRGRQRSFYAMPFGERYIWGATAGMLKNMHQRLFQKVMRVIIENILLFLLPVTLYVGYVLLTRRDTTTAGTILNDAPLVWLFAAGAVLVLITLVAFGSTSGSKPGQTYYPPYSKDGRIVPGEYK